MLNANCPFNSVAKISEKFDIFSLCLIEKLEFIFANVQSIGHRFWLIMQVAVK